MVGGSGDRFYGQFAYLLALAGVLRGAGPGLRGARGRPKWRSRILTKPAPPSGRPMRARRRATRSTFWHA
jgi:hypothetical protein